MDTKKCIIAVPIYKPSFNEDEFKSITQLFKVLGQYDIMGYCPTSLDISYYTNNFKFKSFYGFWDEYFYEYPKGYNKLMLQPGFYDIFSGYEYVLIYQPDAWVFRDELEYWCDKGYDYIGAPFLFTRNEEYKLASSPIGNGGFSLRKISFWKEFCEKQKEMCEYVWEMSDNEYGEDHIFTALSQCGINNFNLPTYAEACAFAFDTDPHISFIINNYKLPFGCHGYNKVMGKYFYNDYNLYGDKKIYSVVTYLFGDYDILRDPDEVDPSAEYICLTDRKDLQSDVWQFVELEGWDLSQYNDWQKTLIARYTALNYIHTDICIKIDASVHIKKSLSFVKNILTREGTIDACFLIHPWRDKYLSEYDEWIATRNLDPKQKDVFINYCEEHGYDYNAKGMIMSTIIIMKNNEVARGFDSYVLNELMNTDNFNIRVDQTYLSIIFGNLTSYMLVVKFLSMQVLESDYLEYFYHGKQYTHNGEYRYDKNVADFNYFNNKKYPCIYFT